VRHPILLAAAALAAGILLGSQLAGALPADSTFTLEQNDKIIAEAPGCYASCQALGTVRRCTIKQYNCHAVCQLLPECRLPAANATMKVCALVRDANY
jgi:hypothetical protein